jgi:hypothetical protein
VFNLLNSDGQRWSQFEHVRLVLAESDKYRERCVLKHCQEIKRSDTLLQPAGAHALGVELDGNQKPVHANVAHDLAGSKALRQQLRK